MVLDFSIVSASVAVANFDLGQVWRTYHLLDKSIDREIGTFRDEVQRLPAAGRDDLADERINDEYGELVDLSRINNYSAVVLAYAVLERFFMDVFNSAKLEILDIVGDDEKQLNLKGYIKELRKVGIDLESPPFDIAAIRRFNGLRNSIMHHGGYTLGKWIGDNYLPGDQIAVSRKDVEDFSSLAGRTCQLIAEQYEAHARAMESASKLIQ